jgi:hypothetical protein
LLKLVAGKKEAGKAYGLLTVKTPAKGEPVTPQTPSAFRSIPKSCARRGGAKAAISYAPTTPPTIPRISGASICTWSQVFKELKSDLAMRPLHHQLENRIEARISSPSSPTVVTLKQRLKALAPGPTPRVVIEKLGAIQMIDVELPMTDGRLQRFKLDLPTQPPPEIAASLQG